MFGKLLAIVLVLAIMALALLVERQKRYETMLEISRTHARIIEQERGIWRLRAEVARRIRPNEMRHALGTLAVEWQPMPHRLDQPAPPSAPRLAVDRPHGHGDEVDPGTRIGG
ncbi:MAG: hypothetical protein KF724_01235 [Phycisphaeraceae bacterium]|nr:hypothetical protein [Phycisphaeraceae bacterium]